MIQFSVLGESGLMLAPSYVGSCGERSAGPWIEARPVAAEISSQITPEINMELRSISEGGFA